MKSSVKNFVHALIAVLAGNLVYILLMPRLHVNIGINAYQAYEHKRAWGTSLLDVKRTRREHESKIEKKKRKEEEEEKKH